MEQNPTIILALFVLFYAQFYLFDLLFNMFDDIVESIYLSKSRIIVFYKIIFRMVILFMFVAFITIEVLSLAYKDNWIIWRNIYRFFYLTTLFVIFVIFVIFSKSIYASRMFVKYFIYGLIIYVPLMWYMVLGKYIHCQFIDQTIILAWIIPPFVFLFKNA